MTLGTLFSSEGQWVWQAIGTVAVVVTLYGLYRQVRLQNAAHIIDAIEGLIETWNSRRHLELRRRVSQNLLDDSEYFGSDCEELLEIFERLGIYLRKSALPRDVIWDAFSWYIEHYHFLLYQGVIGMRRHYNDQLIFENFHFLAVQMHNHSRSRFSKPMTRISDEDLKNFLNSEIDTANLVLDQLEGKD